MISLIVVAVMVVLLAWFAHKLIQREQRRADTYESRLDALETRKLAKEYDLDPQGVLLVEERPALPTPHESSDWGSQLNQFLSHQSSQIDDNFGQVTEMLKHHDMQIQMLIRKTTPECQDAHIMAAESDECIRCGKPLERYRIREEWIQTKARRG